jgi:hypothetical protein
VGLVGHCSPDASFLTMAIRRASAEVEVIRLHDDQAVLDEAYRGTLLLVNRAMEPGYRASNGVEYIQYLRAEVDQARLMLVSNFAEAQAQAVASGALPGFGKDNLMSADTSKRLREAMSEQAGVDRIAKTKP